jgi:aryl-alcohol dehydrogenase-like predicted oxidoreductase
MDNTPLGTTLLGKTGLDITRVGFGAWAIGGGGWEFGWGPQDDDDSIAAIHHALELGVNWIDTAAAYGFGRSEQTVGRALQGLRDHERPYVFTKASLVEGPGRTVVHNLKRDSILREAEASLKRLGIDAIDLYQIHWPIPDADIEEGWAAFAELQEQGLVRHIGVSNFSVAQLRRAEAIAPVETVQPQYSLIDRDAEAELLPFAERSAIGVIVYSPMASGLLSGGMTRSRIARMPMTTGASTIRGSPSRVCRTISCSWSGCGGSRIGTPRPREPWRSPGLSATRPWTAPSSASAAPTRSTRSWPPPRSS